jgi:5-methylcytosine-specific restriction endonuclease McrA
VPANGKSQLLRVRRNTKEAEKIIKELFPSAHSRGLALSLLAEAIHTAARVAPASWGVSLFSARLCLNVGRGAVLQFYPNEIVFIVTGRLLEAIPQKKRELFRYNHTYSFVPDAIEGILAADKLDSYAAFRSAHMNLIERASQNRKICFWPNAHSPSVIEFLKSAGQEVPSPEYSGVIDDASTSRTRILDIDEADHITTEGRRILKNHIVIERRPALIRRKKEMALRKTERLSCEVCGFDFEEKYGSVGHAFAEVHHLKPLSSSQKARTVQLSDLAIVCSNCHRMLHRGSPVFGLIELRERIQNAAQQGAPGDAKKRRA